VADDLTPEELDRLVAEAEALGAQVTPDEHRDFMRRMEAYFDRRAFTALLNGDMDRSTICIVLAEAAAREAER
jgi:hypothetical protein